MPEKRSVAALLLLFFLLPLRSQDLQHGVTVTLKLIQVYVVDRDGRPVTDLEASDFRIKDNGVPQKITEFERHLLRLPEGPGDANRVPSGPPETGEAPSPMNRKFFLFFDFAFNSPKGIMKARDAALHFLETQVQPSDDVGLLSYDVLRGVSLQEYLTTDHRKIRSAVENIGLKNALGRSDSLESPFWNAFHDTESFDLSAPLKSGWDTHITEGNADSEATRISKNREDKAHMLFFIEGVTNLAKALRYIPGYKFIVLFSAGIPTSVLYGAQYLAGELDTWVDRSSRRSSAATGQGDHVLKTAYEAMLKEMTGANTAIFSFDTRDPEALLNTFGNDSRLTGAYPLERLAGFTGGTYFGHIENYSDHLAQMQNLTGSYYVLGYPIAETWDGAYHRIKVEVTRRGCEVRAQRGYFGSKPFRNFSALEKKLHLVDLALSEQPLFQTPAPLPAEAVQGPSAKGDLLCLLSRIPGEGVYELFNPKAELFTMIFDDRDTIIRMRRVEIEAGEYTDVQMFYYSVFSLPPGTYKGRTVIRNLETGDAAVGACSFAVPEPSKRGMCLLSPLLLGKGKAGRYMRAATPDEEARNLPGVSLKDFYPFNPAEWTPLVGEASQAGGKIRILLPLLWTEQSSPPLAFAAGLASRASGQWVPLKTAVLSGTPIEGREGDVRIFLLELETDLPEMEKGDYIFHLSALQTDSNDTAAVEVPLKVRRP